jgi:hypothetical protein
MAKSKFSSLKGLRLYNALYKELGDANKKLPKVQQLSVSARRKIVSEQLYPKFKNAPKVLSRDVNSDIRKIVKALPPIEICNPLYLSEAYLSFVEYYEIDNHIRRVLPECLDVRVNAGALGMTKIFNTSNYSYYTDGVQKIIEAIRNDLAENESGIAYFNGIVKVKPRRKDNGSPENYFVDYVLYINDEATASEDGKDFSLPKREVKKVEKVKDYLVERFKVLQKEKRSRKRKAKKIAIEKKKQEPKEQKKQINQSIQNAISTLRLLLKNGVITKSEFEAQKNMLQKRKK